MRAALAVFTLALATRLGFWLLSGQPLLYTHQYQYFTNGLRIAEHPEPLDFVLRSDEWRLWDMHWTTAPLYYLFEAALFVLFGPHLWVLRLVQCVLESLTAVVVAVLGRELAGPRGWWAGMIYAVQWFSVELPCWTLTENLHILLFVAAVTALVKGQSRAGLGLTVIGGLLLGLAALTRAVTSAFIVLAGLWRAAYTSPRGRWLPAAALVLSGAAVVLPWTARNVLLIGEPVLIETAAFENIWYSNSLVDRERFRRQEQMVHGQPTPAAKRAAALQFAIRGVQRRPGAFLDKVRGNFWHFLRPEGLHNLLTIERSLEPWRHAGTILLDDLVLFLALPPFVVFLLVGRSSPARSLIVLWTLYYLLMVVVVFHNEIRYRSLMVPFLLAGGAGGWRAVVDGEGRRRWAALVLGLGLTASVAAPYAPRAWRAASAALAMRPAAAALARGDLVQAEQATLAAAAKDSRSPRPWATYGRLLAKGGHTEAAIEAYRRASGLASIANWSAIVALPRLLREAGHADEAAHALRTADALSWNTDPWLILETAWRELPPPRTDEIVLGQGDYGMVRGFMHPRGGDPKLSRHRLEWSKYEQLGTTLPPPGTHRWSLGRAWLRLIPTRPAPAYDVTLHMGAPFPATVAAPTVAVRVNEGQTSRITLDAQIRPYTLRAAPAPDGALLVRLEAPTWSRPGEPAGQGVRVDRLTVSPAS